MLQNSCFKAGSVKGVDERQHRIHHHKGYWEISNLIWYEEWRCNALPIPRRLHFWSKVSNNLNSFEKSKACASLNFSSDYKCCCRKKKFPKSHWGQLYPWQSCWKPECRRRCPRWRWLCWASPPLLCSPRLLPSACHREPCTPGHYLHVLQIFISHLGESLFEGGGDGAVDEEVGGEVEHDKEVSHWLEAHHPEGGNVLVVLLNAPHLLFWTRVRTLFIHCSPTSTTTRTPRKILRMLQRMCMKTTDMRVTARLISPCLCLLWRPLKIFRVFLRQNFVKLFGWIECWSCNFGGWHL